MLIALSSGECAFPWAVTLCIRLITLLPLGSGGGFAELERLLVAQVSDAFAECRVEEPRPVPPRMLPGRRGCPPTFRWTGRRVWACRWLGSKQRASSDWCSRPDPHRPYRPWGRRRSIRNLLTSRGDQTVLVRSLPCARGVVPRGPLCCRW